MYKQFMIQLKKEISKKTSAKLAFSLIITFSLLATFVFLSPYDPNAVDMSNRFDSPNLKHLFGTDKMGRDYFTRILFGGRVSLSVGFLSMLIATSIGTIVGTISGYFQGKIDVFLMRLVDVLMSIPSFFIILVLNAYFKPSILSIICIIGFLGWMETARLVRAETLSIKKNSYVLYAKSLGISHSRIIVNHIIPSILPTIIVAATLSIATAILTESSLSFLGMGVKAPDASWGSMLSKSQAYMDEAPYLSLFPGLCILFTVLSFSILGDTLGHTINRKSGDAS